MRSLSKVYFGKGLMRSGSGQSILGQENTSRGKDQKAEYGWQEADTCSVGTGKRRSKKSRWRHRAGDRGFREKWPY